jgi:hypothetical protein
VLHVIGPITASARITRKGTDTMGIFEQITSALGGAEPIERFAAQRANFDDPKSRDFEHWNQMIGAAPPEYAEEAFTKAARDVDPQEYADHITPGVRGTDPLGEIGKGGLGTVAGALLRHLGGGGGLGNLTDMIPGLRNTDPNRMSPDEVARMAEYMRRHNPEAFGRAAQQIGRQQPGLLQQLLGNKGLLLAGAALAAKVMADRSRRVA